MLIILNSVTQCNNWSVAKLGQRQSINLYEGVSSPAATGSLLLAVVTEAHKLSRLSFFSSSLSCFKATLPLKHDFKMAKVDRYLGSMKYVSTSVAILSLPNVRTSIALLIQKHQPGAKNSSSNLFRTLHCSNNYMKES